MPDSVEPPVLQTAYGEKSVGLSYAPWLITGGVLLLVLVAGLLAFQLALASRLGRMTDSMTILVDSVGGIEARTDQMREHIAELEKSRAPQHRTDPERQPLEYDTFEQEPSFPTVAERTLYRQLRDELDVRYPPYVLNDAVRLRQTSGRILRGVLTEIEPDAVVLMTENGFEQAFYFDTLDHSSRVRVDPNMREEAILRQMQRLRSSPRPSSASTRRMP